MLNLIYNKIRSGYNKRCFNKYKFLQKEKLYKRKNIFNKRENYKYKKGIEGLSEHYYDNGQLETKDNTK